MKVLGVDINSLALRMAEAFDQEVSLMHYLGRHKNIAGLLGWCDEPMAMLMKFYECGWLQKVIQSGLVNTKLIKLNITLDISRGLDFMHSKGVANCEMKTLNVLVDRNENGILFGALAEVVNLRGASIAYAAPEVVTRFRVKVCQH